MPRLTHTARRQSRPPEPASSHPAPLPCGRLPSLQRWFAAVTAAARNLSTRACLTAHASRHAGRAAPAWAGLLAVSAALLLATLLGAAGQARAAVLISNIGQPNGTTTEGVIVNGPLVQAFTTGSNANGYTLESVEVVFEDPIPGTDIGNYAVGVWTANAMGDPLASVHALTNPASATARMPATFTAPTNATLDASTTYVVRVTSSRSAATKIWGSKSDAEDAGGATGWSIADAARRFQVASMAWKEQPDGKSAYIRINGAVRTGNASGAPAITGTATVGQTLTAGAGDIADTDGLPTTTFPSGYSFQWVLVDGSNETDIAGATSRTLKLAGAELGKKVKVKVSFTDGASNDEEVTSAAYPVSENVANPAAPAEQYLEATLTVRSYSSGEFGCRGTDCPSALTENEFTVDGTDYRVAQIEASGGAGSDALFVAFASPLTQSVIDTWVFEAGGVRLRLRDADSKQFNQNFGWNRAGLTWSNGDTVAIKVGGPPMADTTAPGLDTATVNATSLVLTYDEALDESSVPAPDAFTVTVTALGGTVSTRALADTDPVAVSGATVTLTLASTVAAGQTVTVNQVVPKADIDDDKLVYTPAANASGTGYARFTFRVSDGEVESASAYTMTLDVTAVNDAPTSQDATVSTDEDTVYTFAATDFPFTDVEDDALASVTVVTLPTGSWGCATRGEMRRRGRASSWGRGCVMRGGG